MLFVQFATTLVSSVPRRVALHPPPPPIHTKYKISKIIELRYNSIFRVFEIESK